MDGVDNGLEHGFKLKPGFVSVGREAVAYEFGESGVGEVAFVDFLKTNELLPADEFHTLSHRVGYCNAVIGRGGNNVAAAVGFAVRANEADVDGVDNGLALDLAGDGSSAAIVPSTVNPNQREGLFTANFVGVIMPVRDLIVVPLKHEIVIRRNGADVLFANLLNRAYAVGSPQIEGLGIFRVLNFIVGALEDYGELAKVSVSRAAGLVGLFRLFAAFVFDFYFNLILIVSVVRGKGRVIIAEGSRIGEDAIDHVVGAEGLGHVDYRDAVGVKLAGKAISVNWGCAFVDNLILRLPVAGHGNLVKQRNRAVFGNRYLAVNRVADAGEPFGSFGRAIYEFLRNPVQLIADFYFYYGISCASIGDFLQRQFGFRYRHAKAVAVNGADKSNAGDLIDGNARVLSIGSSISRIRIQVVDVIVSTIVIPLVGEVIGIGMLIAIAVYLYGGYLNIAGIIGSAICRIVNVGDFVLEGVVSSAGAVTHDMVSMSAAGGGFRSVNDPVLVDYGRGLECISTAVLIGLPADEILRAIVRISGHVGANALSSIDIDDVVQLPDRFPNGLEIERYRIILVVTLSAFKSKLSVLADASRSRRVVKRKFFVMEDGSCAYNVASFPAFVRKF